MSIAPAEPFYWGEGGAESQRERAKKLRAVADEMLKRSKADPGAIDTSPVGHWTQGAARVANAAVAAILRGREAKQAQKLAEQASGMERAATESANASMDPILSSFGGGSARFPAAPAASSAGREKVTDALTLIKQQEGFRDRPYWDVNALRTGYGSDTVTMPDGSVKRVTAGTRVTRDDAERDLQRRVSTEFMPKVAGAVGEKNFAQMPDGAKGALASIAYNYGSLPKSVARAVQTPGIDDDVAAIRGLARHNGGINAKRRNQEADIYLQSIGGGQPAPVDVASLDPSIGLPAYAPVPAQKPGVEAVTRAMQGQQPQQQQVAQAAPQGVPPMPGPGITSLDQIVGSNTPVANAPEAPKLNIGMLMQALQNPDLNDGQRQLAQSLLQQEMQKQDPAYQMQQEAARIGLEKDRLQLYQMRNPAPPKPDMQNVGGRLVQIMPDGTVKEAYAPPVEPKPVEPTSEQRNYEYAIDQLKKRGVPEGSLPSFQEWSKPKSRGIVFTGPDGTQVQIGGDGGSPLDGTSLPAEVGARIGLGESFLSEDYPQIIEMIKNGDATGPMDFAAGALGRGNAGIVQRRMATGVDALRRGLTGAGMSAAESGEYASRYTPQLTDDAETLRLKAEGLKTDLEAVASGAILGKAGKIGGMLPDQTKKKKAAPTVINGFTIEEVE